MKCVYCKECETKVLDSRETNDITRRRRECEKCSKRFTTYERVENIELTIIKKDGRREPFNRDKIKIGIEKACQKRPISKDKINETINEIENELREKDDIEIPSKDLGEIIIKKLKKLDKVAYIRFASVYRDFKDVKDFEEEIKKIKR